MKCEALLQVLAAFLIVLCEVMFPFSSFQSPIVMLFESLVVCYNLIIHGTEYM